MASITERMRTLSSLGSMKTSGSNRSQKSKNSRNSLLARSVDQKSLNHSSISSFNRSFSKPADEMVNTDRKSYKSMTSSQQQSRDGKTARSG